MATINKRLTLGRPLTNAEIDQNFENLNNAKAELSGTVPMTGNLNTPGLKATSLANGLRIYNFEDELVATFGKDGTQDLIIEGALSIKGQSNNNDIIRILSIIDINGIRIIILLIYYLLLLF